VTGKASSSSLHRQQQWQVAPGAENKTLSKNHGQL
jgi:hypothetical protein